MKSNDKKWNSILPIFKPSKEFKPYKHQFVHEFMKGVLNKRLQFCKKCKEEIFAIVVNVLSEHSFFFNEVIATHHMPGFLKA